MNSFPADASCGGAGQAGRPAAGDDVILVVPLDFLEAALGKEQPVEVRAAPFFDSQHAN